MKDILFDLLGYAGVAALIIGLAAAGITAAWVILCRTAVLLDYLRHRKRFMEWADRERELTRGSVEQRIARLKRENEHNQWIIKGYEKALEGQEETEKEEEE